MKATKIFAGTHRFLLLFLLVVVLVEFNFVSDARLLSDESYNFRQVTRLLRGDISMEPEMNVIPGYHALVALALFVTGKTGLFSARLFSTALSFLTILIFFLLAQKIAPRAAIRKTLLFSFFPLLFPFFSLVYTDILGLGLVLLAFYLILIDRPNLGAVAGLMSVLARTNNISWLLFLYVFVYIENYGLDLGSFRRSLRHTWVFLLGFGFFAAFLIFNGGIAISNQEVQPLFKFIPGNVYFLLFLCGFLFLPYNLYNLRAGFHLIGHRKWLLALLLLIYAIYLLTFSSTHPYNQSFPDYYLRNKLLIWATSGVLPRTIFFIPIGLSLLSLSVTQLSQDRFYWLYPFTLLSLLPFWLIEPRYAFVPLSLFLLFSKQEKAWLDWTTVSVYLPLSIYLLVVTRAEIFFI